MKKLLSKLTILSLGIFFSTTGSAQTTGVLTFTFTEVPVATASTYQSTGKHDLAVWIQTSAGAFVKTKLRYAGGGTSDHLPTWASQASCTGGSCISAGCNTVDGTTGATQSSFKTYTVSWDGKKGAAATGTVQPDGVYKVTIQSTWNHGTGGTATTSYTFTKGPTVDDQAPANTTNFSNVVLHWQPTGTVGIDETASNPTISVAPNPSNGIFNVDFKNANSIKVFNALGVLVYDEKIEQATEGTKAVDLSSFSDGIYFINVSNGKGSINHKIILNK